MKENNNLSSKDLADMKMKVREKLPPQSIKPPSCSGKSCIVSQRPTYRVIVDNAERARKLAEYVGFRYFGL